ncbi:MAG: hypothetical protein QXK88_04040 [Desulfurococcaceae archaeon]
MGVFLPMITSTPVIPTTPTYTPAFTMGQTMVTMIAVVLVGLIPGAVLKWMKR